jgi:hypothetical protein
MTRLSGAFPDRFDASVDVTDARKPADDSGEHERQPAADGPMAVPVPAPSRTEGDAVADADRLVLNRTIP